MTELLQYTHSNDIFEDAKQIILSARKRAYKAADTSLVMQNWFLGQANRRGSPWWRGQGEVWCRSYQKTFCKTYQ